DLAGNSATVLSKTVYIDATAPVSLTATVTEGTSCGGSTDCVDDINVTLSANDVFTNNSGLKIYYTTNGDTPTVDSLLYSTPISITSTTTLKYIAVDKYSNTETGTLVNYNFAINTAPSFDQNVSDYSIDEDADSFLIDLNATDADGDPIIYTLTSNNESIISVLSLGDGNFTLTPVANAFGDVTLTATATANGQQVNDYFDINVSSVNDTPTISGDPVTSIDEDSVYSFTVRSDDNDTVTGDTARYTISGDPDWMDINESTGVVSGTPEDADVGTTSNIVVTVTDTDGLTANLSVFSVVVNNTNDAPTITGDPDNSVNEDSLYSFIPTATDGEVNFAEILTFNITNRPSWASFNTADGNLSGTPTNTNVGTYSDINISVKDESNVTVSLAIFSIDVNNTNDAPTISGTPITNINNGENYNFSVTGSDVDIGDTNSLVYGLIGNPTWMSINTSTGEINGTANYSEGASWDISVTVADTNNSTTTLTYTLNVTNIIGNTAPVINTTFNNISKNEDFDQFSISIDINDTEGDDLNLSIESNGSSIVSFTGMGHNISQGDYNNSQ
ncbi:MAG: putative Ig domain-containing protein, partial [Arcobacteraceae bacterium]|nr:putative Ig domain-containing protein [Arcobacteraceae bacterium]